MPRSSLPPFLEKLQIISESLPEDIAGWTEDGMTYRVYKAEEFEKQLKRYFKGNVQTFIRQLHFYGFRKLDSQNGSWSFAHKEFVKGYPELLHNIKRKTRTDPTAEAPAAKSEVHILRDKVAFLQDVVDDLRAQLDSVITVLDEAGVAEIEKRSTDLKPLKIRPGSKRPRSEKSGAFLRICEDVIPVLMDSQGKGSDFVEDQDLDSASLGALSSSDLSSLDESLSWQDNDTDDFSGSDGTSAVSDDNILKEDCNEVISSISQATKLDHDSVSRVVSYFRALSTKEHSNTSVISSLPLADSVNDLMTESYDSLSDSILSFKKPQYFPPLQKVR